MFSNRYIYIYSTILVVIVAAVLALAAVLLKPFQDRNVEIEKIQDILKSVHVESTPQNAEELYNQYIVEELAVNNEGAIIASYRNGKQEGEVRPFFINLKEQLNFRRNGKNAVAPIYVCKKDGKIQFVIPMLGNGLWGPLWGNIALSDDFSTITGVTFDHKGETPGLGAEIAAEAFQSKFVDKQIFNNEVFTSVLIKKNANKSSTNEVDALSGGTITSDGVSSMLKENLSFYIPFKTNTLHSYLNK